MCLVIRSVISATMDMGVGNAGLVKLGRHLDMNVPTGKTYVKHPKEISHANMVATASVIEAVQVVRKLYGDRDASSNKGLRV